MALLWNYKKGLQMAILFLLISLLYIPFLRNEYIFDDHNLYRSLLIYEYAIKIFNFELRTLPYFTLGIVHVLNENIIFTRIVSLFLHFFTACLIYVLINKLLSFYVQNERKIVIVSLICAIYFAVNPVIVYGAGYLAQRTIVFTALFLLLSIIFLIESIEKEKYSLGCYSILFYILSVYSKGHALTFPLVILCLFSLILINGNFNEKKRNLVFFYLIATSSVSLVVFLSVRYVIGAGQEPEISNLLPLIGNDASIKQYGGLWFYSAMHQASLFFDYIYFYFFPDIRYLSIDKRIDFSYAMGNWIFFPKIICFLLTPIVALIILYKRKNYSLFGVGLLYCWFLFMTEIVSVRIQEPFVLYRCYLWAPGYSLMLASLVINLNLKKILIVFLPVLFCLFFLSKDRLSSMKNDGAIWIDAAEKLQNENVLGSGRIFYNRGLYFSRQKRYEEAIIDFSKTIEKNPDAYYAYYAKAIAFYRLDKYQDAKIELEKSLEIKPDDGASYYALGMIWDKWNCNDEALKAYKESLRLGVALANLGIEKLEKEPSTKSCTKLPFK